MKLNELGNKIGSVLDGISTITAAVAPKVAAPVMLASKALKKFSELDAADAENSIGGLTLTATELSVMLDNYKKSGEIDEQKLNDLIENLKVIDASLDKFYKIVS